MSKAERTPPFIMKVDGQRLVPGSAWDAERLASYRNGSTVNVIITQEKASWRQRKYWAILGAVVKAGAVRQTRAEDLHKAIRLKLGIVESFTTLGGAIKVELRSTTAMDEQEFEGFYREAMELLKEITGVDVETLGKESADVGLDEPAATSPSDGSAAESTGEPAGETSPDSRASSADGAFPSPGDPVGASISGEEPEQPAREAADQEGGAEPKAQTPSEAPPSTISPKDKAEMIAKLLAVATDQSLPEKKDRAAALGAAADSWLFDLGEPAKPFITTVFTTARKVIKGEMASAQAREYLEALV